MKKSMLLFVMFFAITTIGSIKGMENDQKDVKSIGTDESHEAIEDKPAKKKEKKLHSRIAELEITLTKLTATKKSLSVDSAITHLELAEQETRHALRSLQKEMRQGMLEFLKSKESIVGMRSLYKK